MIADNLILPFEVKPLGIRGKLVRLGAVVDDILHRHDYPPPVSELLAEAVALTAMLGASLKFDGKFIFQTRTDGPVNMVVADYVAPGRIRGYARVDGARINTLKRPTQQELLGQGHLAMTVDQGPDMERYQGIVALDGTTLTGSAHTYFAQSEQIPTSLKLAAGPLIERGSGVETWRAGAIMVQHLPRHGGSSPVAFSSGDAPEGTVDEVREADDWVKAKYLLETTEAHEMLDPLLAPEDLLYRLYHEDGVTVYPSISLQRHCTCSATAVTTMLQSFSTTDRADMVKDGKIEVICEFCSTPYRFDPAEFADS